MKWKAYFGTNRVSLFFFKILYCIFYSSYDIFIRRVLEVIEKLRPFARRSVLIWVNCLEDILITHFFLSAILVPLWVTLFLLINSQHFHICLFFVKSKDFIYEFSWILSTKWNSSGVIDSKILPCKCFDTALEPITYNMIDMYRLL